MPDTEMLEWYLILVEHLPPSGGNICYYTIETWYYINKISTHKHILNGLFDSIILEKVMLPLQICFFSPIFHVPVNEANILKTSFCFNVFEIHFVCIHIAPILSHIRRRKWQPTPLLLPGKSQGRRSPVSCSPWGR